MPFAFCLHPSSFPSLASPSSHGARLRAKNREKPWKKLKFSRARLPRGAYNSNGGRRTTGVNRPLSLEGLPCFSPSTHGCDLFGMAAEIGELRLTAATVGRGGNGRTTKNRRTSPCCGLLFNLDTNPADTTNTRGAAWIGTLGGQPSKARIDKVAKGKGLLRTG